MQQILLLDSINLHYSANILQQLSKKFAKTILIYQENIAPYSIDEVALLSDLFKKDLIEMYKAPPLTDNGNDVFTLFYLIGLYKNNFDEIHISSNSVFFQQKDLDLNDILKTPPNKIHIEHIPTTYITTDYAYKTAMTAISEQSINTPQPLKKQQLDVQIPSQPTQPTIEKEIVATTPPSSKNIADEFSIKGIFNDTSNIPTLDVQEQQKQTAPIQNPPISQEYPNHSTYQDEYDEDDFPQPLSNESTSFADKMKQEVLSRTTVKNNGNVIAVLKKGNSRFNQTTKHHKDNAQSWNKKETAPVSNSANYAMSKEDEIEAFQQASRKEAFKESLIQLTDATYFSENNQHINPNTLVGSQIKAEKQGLVIANGKELNVVRLTCASFVKAQYNNTPVPKNEILNLIDLAISEEGDTTVEVSNNTIFSKLKRANVLTKTDSADLFTINKGFVLYLLNNHEIDTINYTFDRYEKLLSNQKYNQLLEMSISLSPKDACIIASLSTLILTSQNYNARPKTADEFEKALMLMFSNNTGEVHYATSLLKRYETINFFKDGSEVYNDPKLLRLSTLKSALESEKAKSLPDLAQAVEPTKEVVEPTKQDIEPPELTLEPSPNLNQLDAKAAKQEVIKKPFTLKSVETFDLLRNTILAINTPKPITETKLKAKLEPLIGDYDTEEFLNRAISYWLISKTPNQAKNGENQYIVSNHMKKRLKQDLATYELFVERIAEIVDYSSSVKQVKNKERLFLGLSKIQNDPEKLPKIYKGILSLMTRASGNETEGKVLTQILQNVQLFKLIGKRVQFQDSAIDYWNIQYEAESQKTA